MPKAETDEADRPADRAALANTASHAAEAATDNPTHTMFTGADRLGLDNIGHTPPYLLAAGTPHPQPKWAPPHATLDTFRSTTLT
ncbi:hypothetical protein ABZ816_25805 [Actinosynnema sp. NPDC047251]|uniref:Uncharacterized protein n=1 Tax=Saccharothrix espanaensis (strain ATCC 51144 / DSM 44229 / JCM 9112 / NBRC 15066 / NRRL 15764) TaxID=1179773 RepID=K0K5I6_SACES|nr:hypothetical protein [Saccharothrix espanaensis]CCH31823.1 hypothetical protein BN6_45430 [Saccharothrix espanaensis DSM 44229]